MSTRYLLLASLLASGVLLTLALPFPAAASDDDGLDAKAAKLAPLVRDAKVALRDALTTAEKQVPGGKVVSAELEFDDDKLMYEVWLLVPGEHPKLVEVEICAKTGTVLADDDQDDGDDDDDDEDDGDDDDKGGDR
ncbi:MAG: PepSY domain-containing protein [Planctomycetota bacterium]